MEVDQIQCKFPRISNGYSRLASTRLSQREKMDDQYPDDEEEGENKRSTGDVGRFYGWPSSRIVRVSRASGGKDRHSKVLTSKGLRDRRVRLSVNTAIQFYDLQDRLGYDQPSKAVEWLLTAAASSIAELPPMNTHFPDTPKQLSDKKRFGDQLGFNSVANDSGGGGVADPKSSACSSNSETSKGSGLSISRSESRIKARERAKERVAEKEKDKENESSYVASFTELLSGGVNNNINGGCNNNSSVHQNPNRGNDEDTDELNLRGWSSSTMDYFTSGLLVPPAATRPEPIVTSPLFSVAADHHSELQPFLFTPENLVSSDRSNEYNLNFTISSSNSSGLAAFNRGTLQSNSSSPPPPLPPPNLFNGATAPIENHHHFLPGFDSRLQLFYGDAHGRHSGPKEKEKN